MSRLQPLLAPASICVIGASPDETRVGGVPLAQLRRLGYAGAVYGVNPKYQEVQGYPCVPEVEALPVPVECAVLAVAAEQVLPLLERCHQKGVRAAVVFAGGFAETATDLGRELQQRLVAFAQRTGMRIAGPNTLGNANLMTGAYTSFFDGFARARPATDGPGIAVISQGGGPSIAIHEIGLRRGLRFGCFIQSGNEACVGMDEYLDDLADDAHVAAAIAYVEGLSNFERFARAAGHMSAAGRPLIVCKGGETERGAEIAQSHTARIAGSSAAWRAAFEQLNIVRAADIEEATEIAYAAQYRARPVGRHVGILTTSGAFGALISDSLIPRGLDVPRFSHALEQRLRQALPSYAIPHNPVDLTANIVNNDASFAETLERMLESSEIDSVLFFSIGGLIDKLADRIISAAARTDKMIAIVCAGPSARQPDLERGGVPIFFDTARGAHAIAALSTWQRRRHGVRMDAGAAVPAMPPLDMPGLLAKAHAARRGQLDEHEAKRLLAHAGIDVPREIVATSPAQAVQAGQAIGYPVVLKILSPDIAHKTEAGGVRLNVREPEAAEAYGQILAAAAAHAPDARLEGVLVQRFEQGGAELLISAGRDPVFGPVVTVGMGGTAAELLGDVVQRLGPVDERTAREMIAALRLFPLLDGYRGAEKLDVDAAARAVARLSALVAATPGIVSIEINPLLVRAGQQGAVAVDALVALDWSAAGLPS